MVARKAIVIVDFRGEDREALRALGRRQFRKPSRIAKDEAEIRKGKKMTGEQLYKDALRLARKADKSGGPLPVAILQGAADSGHPPAMYALANWHLHGKGVPKDPKTAVDLLRKAADVGFPPAEYDLAVCYETGEGVRKNQKTAFAYYLKAANNGDGDAHAEVARCYFFGIGTTKNLAEAMKWYMKAADQGDVDAQYALGGAYERGVGVEQNIQEALRWYRTAAQNGDQEAKVAATELAAEVERAFIQLGQVYASSEISTAKSRKPANGAVHLRADQIRVLGEMVRPLLKA